MSLLERALLILTAHLVVPASATLASGAFLFFLIEVRGLYMPGSAALRFIGGCFVVATVLTERYVVTHDSPARGRLYAAALIGVTFVAMAAQAGGAVAHMLVLLPVWWVASRLTRKLSFDRDLDDLPHGDPAVALARVMLLALVVFAACEPLVMGASPAVTRRAFQSLLLFLLGGGVLLAAASALGTMRHVIDRRGFLRHSVLPFRVLLGMVLSLVLLAGALATPGLRLEGEGAHRVHLVRSRTGVSTPSSDDVAEGGKGSASLPPSEKPKLAKGGKRSRQRGCGGPVATLVAGLMQVARPIAWALAALTGLLLLVSLAVALKNASRARGFGLRDRLAELGRALGDRLRAALPRRSAPAEPEPELPPLDTLAEAPPRAAVRAAYAHFLALLGRHGHSRAPEHTTQDTLAHLPSSLRPAAGDARRLTELYRQAAYGGRELSSGAREDALAALDGLVGVGARMPGSPTMTERHHENPEM